MEWIQYGNKQPRIERSIEMNNASHRLLTRLAYKAKKDININTRSFR